MEKLHPNLWKNDTDDGGKNLHEEDFLNAQLKRLGLSHLKTEYHKITNLKKRWENFKNFYPHLNIKVFKPMGLKDLFKEYKIS